MDLCSYSEARSDFADAVKWGGPLASEYQERFDEACRLDEASHFYWLGLPEETVDADEIKKAYRQQCMKWHPGMLLSAISDLVWCNSV